MELMHRRCCGLDVHKETVVACLRLISDGQVTTAYGTVHKTTNTDLWGQLPSRRGRAEPVTMQDTLN